MQSTSTCVRCGAALIADAAFCSRCGEPVGAGAMAARYADASDRSRLVALVLCAVLGYLGIHRFYVGKIGTGLLWLFTGGLAGVGWIVDLVLIATGDFRDRDGLRLRFWDEPLL